ncbi:MAG TPA: hypothetical protein PLL77_14115 [Pyrinomonadaceae bacterium]|nr:hypothetical protein [Pyrinomonadaceae bacterium]
MNYPLNLSFKLLALASQIYVHDANGNLIGYVKQKLLKLKEDINVFADEGQTQHLFNIKADRIIDFSAKYNFTSASGQSLGSISRKGMRSIFKAHYMIFDENGNQTMEIHEENGWVKVVDALLGEIPLLGMFTGYFFNPSYIVSRMDGAQVARLKKQPAFFEGVFQLEPLTQMGDDEETKVMLSVLTMTLLERARG